MKKESQLKIIDSVTKLMHERNVIAQDIVRSTSITQSKMSRGLKKEDALNFSIDDVCELADFFDVSVDYLLGRKNATSADPVSSEDLCRRIMQLVASDTVTCIDVEVEEDTYQPYDGEPQDWMYPYEYVKKKCKYKGFYFSNYHHLPDKEDISEYEMEDIEYDLLAGGNDNEKGQEINSFIDYYLKFYDLYKKNGLPQDLFETAIEDRLKQMKH